MATAIETSFWPINDANGDPVSGAKIYVYNVGTTTSRAIYSDTSLSVSVSNPIICNSAGRTTTDGGTTVGMVYTATGSYKIVVKTSADVTLYTLDNIDGNVPVGSGALAIANGGTGATSAATALSNLGGASDADLADLASDVAALVGAASSTEKTHLATGTTAQRPASPAEGDVRRNTTTSSYEGYTGAAWRHFATTSTEDPSATDSEEGFIEIAVQSEMETATDVVRAVTPGRQHFHPGHGKFWIKAAGAGTLTASYNITSVTDTGTGVLTVTIATDFSSADYAITIGHVGGSVNVTCANQAAGSFTLNSVAIADGSATDPTTYYAAGLGDQA
jgi:hypothetical protein